MVWQSVAGTLLVTEGVVDEEDEETGQGVLVLQQTLRTLVEVHLDSGHHTEVQVHSSSVQEVGRCSCAASSANTAPNSMAAMKKKTVDFLKSIIFLCIL
jgi:hypothetical protein